MMFIRKVMQNKAEGPDEIHIRFVRQCERYVSLPLAMIFSNHYLISLAEIKVT